MAPTLLRFDCSACDFQHEYLLAGQLRQYCSDDGAQHWPLRDQPGWCADCQALVAMECLPTAEYQAVLVKQLLCLRLDLANLLAAHKVQRRWWQWRARPIPGLVQLERQIETQETELAACRSLREALSARDSGPRCLTCGSVRVAPVPLGSVEAAPRELGIEHPGCGGEMSLSHSNAAQAPKQPVVHHDLQGRRCVQP